MAAILDFSDRTMISADHPRFSCTSDMSLTIYGNIFSGPLVHTNDPSGTGVHMPLLMLAYRSSIHETTGISPAMMMLGRGLTLPVDMTLGRPIRDERFCATEPAYQLEQRLLDIHDFARKHLDISSESMKRRYDIKAHRIPNKVGDAVWYYYPKRRVGFISKL